MTVTERDFSIAIVGGGIGGLCAAIALIKEGVRVDVYEAAAAFSEIGAGVGIGPNAARALGMIDPAAYDAFLRVCTKNAWPSYARIATSYCLGDATDAEVAEKSFYSMPSKTGHLSAHRAHFLDGLVALLPEGISHFGKRLQDITTECGGGGGGKDPGAVTLRFADGSSATHSAVIGCDGVKSVTRRLLFPTSYASYQPVFSGKYAYRGLIPMSIAAPTLGEEKARNAHMYLGHGGHILTFAVAKGDTLNVVAFNTPSEAEANVYAADEKWIRHVDKAAMLADFQGWAEPAQRVLNLLPESLDRWALWDHPAAPTYTSGRLCLLGDAAHASTPHHGGGAGQAVEDALVLARVLGLVTKAADLPRAFRAYDAVRRPRSQKLVRLSRAMGRVYDFEAEETGDDLERVAAAMWKDKEWLWDWDHEKDIVEAQRLFREGE